MATGNATWVNSDIAGTVTEETRFRPQDDFHAFVNRDWLLKAEMHPGEPSISSFRERSDEVQAQVEALLTGEDAGFPAKADGATPPDAEAEHMADLVHTLYAMFMDMDTRNARGIEPIMPIVDRIRGISTLQGFTDYLGGPAYLDGTSPVATEVFADKKDSLRYVCYLDHDDLSLVDANEYRNITPQGERTRKANEDYFAAMLALAGVPEAEAGRMVASMESFEQLIGEACLGADAQGLDDFDEITYNPMTRADLEEASPAFPLIRILEAQGIAGSEKFVLGEPEWLARMDAIYTEENLEGMKALSLFKVFARFGSYLDQRCFDLAEEWKNARLGSSGNTPLAKKAYNVTCSLLGMAVGRMYVDRYLTDETKSDVEGLIARVIDTYRERLRSAEWLSEATREKAVEKLDAMTVRVGRPNRWPDYGDLDLAAESAEPGASMDLVEAYRAIAAFEQRREMAKVNQAVDREEWVMPPQVVNAYYLPTDNSINILAGILGGVFYDAHGSVEERMGGIGMVIGHEITHAFDRHGSRYDRDGNLGESWWTDEDRAAFKERADKVAAYWSGIEVLPGRNIDGMLTCGENIADLGGMSNMAAIGRGISGFDWKAFFTAYARDWRLKEAPQLAEFLLMNDVHAPGHLRTNGVVQQIPEFYEAFDVRPGDGMYLEEERRLEVW